MERSRRTANVLCHGTGHLSALEQIVKSIRTLFIGNSFTNRNDLPGMVTRLAATTSPPRRVETARIIANGRALKTHWERGEALKAIQSSK